MKIYVYFMVLFTLGYAGVYHGAGRTLRRVIGPGFYLAIASTYFVAFLTPWPSILLLWCALAVWIGAANRVEVACRYVLVLPLLPSLQPLLMAGGHVIGEFSPGDFLGLGAVAATLVVSERPRRARPRGFHAEEAAILVLLLIFGVAAVRLADLSLLIRTVLSQGLAIALPFWIVRRNVRTREEVRLVGACLGVVAAILGVIALYERHAGWVLLDTLSQRFMEGQSFARSSYLRGGALRASATLGGPIELGIVMTLGILGTINARGLFTSAAVWAGMLAMSVLGLLASQSRGALAATVLGLFVVLLVQRRFLLCALFAGSAAVGYAVLKVVAVSSEKVAAFMGEGREVGVYKDYRTLLLERGLEEGRKHPILGTTMDNLMAHLTDLMQGEHIIDLVNSYLHVYLISGLVGLGALLAALLLVYRALWQRTRASLDAPDERARAFVLSGLTALLFQLATTSFYGRTPAFLACLLAAARVIRATDVKFRRPPRLPVLWETGQVAPRAPAAGLSAA